MIAPERWRRDARMITIGGRSIASWTLNDDQPGDMPWLLLIHGYPTSSWDWSKIWKALGAHFRLAAVDMTGFGLSEKPRDITYSIIDQADLQEAFLEQLGVAEAHLLCHDYGDTVGQELLARHNEGALSFRIQSVCFLNGGLFPEQHRARAIQKLGLTPLGPLIGIAMNRARFAKTLNAVFGPATQASNEELDSHWAFINENGGRSVLHKLLRYIPERVEHRERWVGALKHARAPLRLIDGGADPVSGAHLYHYYREQIAHADAVLLPEIGHYPQTEAPGAVLDAFIGFHQKIGTIR